MTTHILSRNLFDELLAQGVVRWDEEEAQYLKFLLALPFGSIK